MNRFREKRWKRRMPKEYRDCTKEELERHIDKLRMEFEVLAKEPNGTMQDILDFLHRNDKLMQMIEVTRAYENEIMLDNLMKCSRKQIKRNKI